MPKLKAATSAKELICRLIIQKKPDSFIIDQVKKQFPESAVDRKHCTKYRRELRNDNQIGVELAPFGSAEHQEWGRVNLAQAKRGPHGVQWKEFDAMQKERAKKAKADSGAKATSTGRRVRRKKEAMAASA